MTTTQIEDISGIVLEQADRLLRAEVSKERLAQADRGEWPAALWDAVEQAGLPLALVPEADGGVGLAAKDAMRVLRRAGYHTLPLPLAETMIAAAVWAEASGQLLDGPVTIAPVDPEDRLEVERQDRGCRLRGTAKHVPWGARANRLLVFARDASGTGHLVLVPQGQANVEGRRNLAFEPRDTVRFDGIAVAEDAVRPAPAACTEGFLHLGALARGQQMVGAMERCLDYAIDYAMERKQFGRPIAKFQAIQHMLAEAAGQFAASSAAADLAADALGTSEFDFGVAVAKARVGEAAGKVAEICHQVHGAMGFTQEHPLHFATRRLWSWRDEFGGEAVWQERIGRQVCERGGAALWQQLVGG